MNGPLLYDGDAYLSTQKYMGAAGGGGAGGGGGSYYPSGVLPDGSGTIPFDTDNKVLSGTLASNSIPFASTDVSMRTAAGYGTSHAHASAMPANSHFTSLRNHPHSGTTTHHTIHSTLPTIPSSSSSSMPDHERPMGTMDTLLDGTNPSGPGGVESSIMTGPPNDGEYRVGAYTKLERQMKIEAFREKKRTRIWRKQIKYDCRKRLADTRPR
jgi:hypothetical protein